MQDLSSLSKQDQELVEMGKQHIKSRYQVDRTSIAAVLRTQSGKIFTGINLKYQARGVSMCAARVALFTAIDTGETEFSILVEVKYFPETDSYEILSSCGECRQVFLSYAPFKEIVPSGSGVKKVEVSELLPYSYV